MPDGATVKTSKAAVGFQYCNKLFAQERKCAVYKPQYRKEYRQNKELPLLEEYFAWLKTVHPEKGSKLEEAVRSIAAIFHDHPLRRSLGGRRLGLRFPGWAVRLSDTAAKIASQIIGGTRWYFL